MIPKYYLSIGLSIFLHNLDLLPYLFTFNFDKIICAYWKKKLNKARDTFSKSKNTGDIIQLLKNINLKIIQDSNSGIEAYYVALYFLVRLKKPTVVIETGVERGASSLFILQALEDNDNGMLYSIDLPNTSYMSPDGNKLQGNTKHETSGICVPDSLHTRWSLTLGNSKIELPRLLEKLTEVDIFVRDDEHTFDFMIWEFEQVFPYLRNDGVIISDNVDINDAMKVFSEKTKSKKVFLRRDRRNFSEFGLIFKK